MDDTEKVERFLHGNGQVRIKFLFGVGPHQAGETAGVPYDEATRLIESGTARAVDLDRDGQPLLFFTREVAA